jgi:hypothetical protein
MQSGSELLKRMIDALLPNRAAPILARVLKSYEGPGKNRYSCDVRELRAGTLEETDRVISEVPISPIWVAKKGKGVFAIPPDGCVVIVEFVEWNVAWPYISGIWSDEYDAAQFRKGQLVVTDGKDLRFEFSDDEILIHDTNKFEMRFVKGKFNVINAGGLKFEINSDTHTISIDNGHGNSIVLSDAGVAILGTRIDLN